MGSEGYNRLLLSIVLDAAWPVRLLMAALVLVTGAAIWVTVTKLNKPIDGGSAALRALRWAGPLAGICGGAYTLLFAWLAVTHHGTASWAAMAPGLAEATFTIGLGLLAGVAGAVGTGLIDARIDRAVLGEP